MVPYAQPWFDAWVESASGAGGFWSDQLPGDHFRTAANTGGALAGLVLSLLTRLPEVRSVIDVGAGAGELLSRLAAHRADLHLAGIDLRPRPAHLPDQISWVTDRWDVRRDGWALGPAEDRLGSIAAPVLVLASEWLDDLPCRIGVSGAAGWSELLVDADGRESLGAPLVGADLSWVRRWWPDGPRAEIGLTRDRAWAQLVAAVLPHGGSALLVDYGHRLGERPQAGSLAAYRQGRRVPVVASPQLNLTAHVAIDAVRAAGEAAGARTHWCRPQAEVVTELWPTAGVSPDPDPDPDPQDPVADLVQRSHRAALSSPAVWGSQWWLWQS